MTRFDRLIRAADRLRRLPPEGSAAADAFLHDLLGRPGPVLPYTSDEAAARLLLPEGFDCNWPTTGAGEVYAAVWRKWLLDGLPCPRHGQWGRTRALALALHRAGAGSKQPGDRGAGCRGDGAAAPLPRSRSVP